MFRLFQVKEVAKDHQRTEEQLKKKLGQNEKLEKTVEHHEEEMRSLELQYEISFVKYIQIIYECKIELESCCFEKLWF